MSIFCVFQVQNNVFCYDTLSVQFIRTPLVHAQATSYYCTVLYCTNMKKVVIKDFKVERFGNGLVSRAHECDVS